MGGCVLLSIASLTIRPPSNLPDLVPLMISVYSCGHFLCFLVYFHWLQFTCDDNIPVLLDTEPPPPVKMAATPTPQSMFASAMPPELTRKTPLPPIGKSSRDKPTKARIKHRKKNN